MLEHLNIRDAVKVPTKDTGTLDSSCFQLIYDSEVITLRAASVSEKRQWINQVDSAKKVLVKHNKPVVEKLKSGNEIGTLNVKVLRALNCLEPGKLRSILVVAKIGNKLSINNIRESAPEE